MPEEEVYMAVYDRRQNPQKSSAMTFPLQIEIADLEKWSKSLLWAEAGLQKAVTRKNYGIPL